MEAKRNCRTGRHEPFPGGHPQAGFVKRSDFFQRKKGDGTPFFPVPGQNPREDYARIHFQISFGVAFFP